MQDTCIKVLYNLSLELIDFSIPAVNQGLIVFFFVETNYGTLFCKCCSFSFSKCSINLLKLRLGSA